MANLWNVISRHLLRDAGNQWRNVQGVCYVRVFNAKAAIAAATAMYTNIEVVGQFGKVDVRTLHEAARKKAVAFVKTPSDKLQGDDS